MTRNPINPFAYGGVVAGDAFCNRLREKADLTRAIQNHEKLFVFSERRFGKTSLVQTVLAGFSKKKAVCAYIDLWPTDNEATFVTAMAKAITHSMSSSVGKLLETGKSLFSNLAPSVTIDEAGKPEVNFGVSKHARLVPALDEVLETPAKIAAKHDRDVVIVFDEFQQVLEYGNDRVEKKLRSVIQNHREVAYLFLGSRKHLIKKMFMDRSRPLYRAGGHYPLGPIAEEDWIPFIRERFAAGGKKISHSLIHSICERTQGHPFYTQHLCHALWELCGPGAAVTKELIQDALRLLLLREHYAYSTLWESLAMNQRKFLKGLASEDTPVKPFAGEFVRRSGLGSPSNAQRAVDSLLDRDVIDRENGSFLIVDRFFRLWVQRVQLP
jgi:AAA+ ATPase superfamily predicted ATPase